MKNIRMRAAAAALAAVMGLSPLAWASEALGHDLHTGSVELSVGTSLTRQIFWSDTYADLRTEQYLTYTPNRDVLPVVSYGETVTSKATLSAMARALESQGKRVVGGTNGDFYVVATGTPLGMVITDGVLRSVPGQNDSWYYAVGFRTDGTAIIGEPRLNAAATLNGEKTVAITGGVNKTRTADGGYFLFTEDFGATTRTSGAGVNVILAPVAENLGESVEVDLKIIDPKGGVTSAGETVQPTPAPTPAPDAGPEQEGSPAAQTADPPADGVDESGELTGGDLPAVTDPPKVLKEIRAAVTRSDRLIVNGRVTCQVLEVAEGDQAAAIAPGTMVLSADGQGDPAALQLLRDLKPGDTVDIDVTAAEEVWTEAQEAMGALYRLVKDGQVQSGLSAERTARTAIGVKADGSIVFYTIDGRQPGYSVGATFTQVAKRLVELGCVEAVGLDGGGSTTIGAAYPGSGTLEVTNRPMNGAQRANSVAVFLTTELAPTGELAHLYVTPSDAILLAGASVQLSAMALDTAYYRMDAPGQVSYSIENGDGRVSADGVFTAGGERGVTQVTAGMGSAVGSAAMTVVKTPDKISVSREDTGAAVTALGVSPNQTVDLKASAVWRNLSLTAQDTCFTWTVDPAVGTVDENGVFTAGDKSASGRLTVSAGGVSASVQITVAGHILTVDGFETGVSAFTSTGSLQAFAEKDQEYVRCGAASARLEYDGSATGTAALPASLGIAEGERQLNLWVYGDGSGNALSATVADGQGTVTETPLTVLDFTGWKLVTAPLPAGARTVRALSIACGEQGQTGRIWLDQVTTANEALTDTVPPTVTPSVIGGQLTASVVDNVDKEMSKAQVSVTWDGAPLDFTFDGKSGILKAALPEGGGRQHRVTVTAADASGNLARSSVDLPAAAEREPVFLDMDGHWAADQVLYLYDRGIIAGMETDEGVFFAPEDNITRGAFFLMAARWLGADFEACRAVELPFDDAAEIPDWALDGVKAMYAMGYLKGSEAGDKVLVRANDTISRAEAMTILGRIQAKGYAAPVLTFTDASEVPGWALPYVETLTAQGVVSGSNNYVRPNDPIRRCEAAKLFYAMM